METVILQAVEHVDPQGKRAKLHCGDGLDCEEMNAKYKETSEGGLAVSLVLC